MEWSWYVAVDMQFFIISPIFLYALYRYSSSKSYLQMLAGALTWRCGVIKSVMQLRKSTANWLKVDTQMDSYILVYVIRHSVSLLT